jgi:hypothetical protein
MTLDVHHPAPADVDPLGEGLGARRGRVGSQAQAAATYEKAATATTSTATSWRPPRTGAERTVGEVVGRVVMTQSLGNRAGLRVLHASSCNIAIRANVRNGSLADMTPSTCNVRFTPNSGHSLRQSECLLWAKSRHQLIIQSPRRRGQAAITGRRFPMLWRF